MTEGRRMRSPLPSVWCLDLNSRLALRYRFGPRNKDTMSLGLCGVGPPHTANVYWVLFQYIHGYTSSTYGIYPRVMSHLRRQLLTGDARRVPMARLYEYCLPRKMSLVWHSGNPPWWRCDTYSVKLTRVDFQSQLSSTGAAVPFYTRSSLLAASPHACSWPSPRWHTLWILDLDPRWH